MPPKRKATSDASLEDETPSKKSQTKAERKAEAHAKALAYKAKLDANKHKSQAVTETANTNTTSVNKSTYVTKSVEDTNSTMAEEYVKSPGVNSTSTKKSKKESLERARAYGESLNKKKTSSSPAAAFMLTEPPASSTKPPAQTKLAAPPAAIANKRQSVDPDGRKESSEEGVEGPKQPLIKDDGMEDAANNERNEERNNDGEELEGTSFAKRMGKRIMSVLFFGMMAQMAYGAFYLDHTHGGESNSTGIPNQNKPSEEEAVAQHNKCFIDHPADFFVPSESSSVDAQAIEAEKEIA
eukprot:scaffold320580_cov182-Cyclotella_meneghiniana.AAC.2